MTKTRQATPCAGRVVLGLLITAMLLCGLSAAQGEPVAIVDGESISEERLVAALKERFGWRVREQLIQSAVVAQAAAKRGVNLSDQQINERLAEEKAVIGAQMAMSGGSFADWLVRQGLTETSYRDRLRTTMLLEKMVAPQVQVTDVDVSAYYEAHRAQLARPEGMEVSQISVASQEEAARIRSEILGGSIAWNEAARQYNLDPYGREDGGLLPFLIPRGDKPGQVAAYALTTDGEISPPFEDEFGWHLMRRESYQAPGTPPLEEIREDLLKFMVAGQTQALAQQLLDALLTAADIKRLGDLTKPGE